MFSKSLTFQIPNSNNPSELAFAANNFSATENEDLEVYNELNSIAEEIERCRSSVA
ncbi:hypothetical protein IKG02_03140 [Candidatus Saccharibacteria bacterium]|nr:hypothetical protein [Candidatus Saccharibacteria bacterium]